MQISLQNFSTLVQNMSASARGASPSLTNLSVGSATRAIFEASAGIALWLQYLILQVMTMCRLATSVGTDVDSWVGDFGMTRLPGVATVGTVTLASLSPGSTSSVVSVGTTVRTSDGAMTFSVIEDDSQPAWSAQAAAYLRPVGTASISVTVQANVAGSVGNVQAGAVNLLGQSVVGIDTVTNPNAFSNGVDGETDSSLRARFANYINTRSRATLAAIESAVAGVQQGLSFTVIENVDASGNYRAGAFLVVVDDGTGSPPASLLSTIAAAVEQVRPVGSSYAIIAPTIVAANVSMAIAYAAGADTVGLQNLIVSAVSGYISGLGVGQALAFSRLASLAYAVSAQVTNVSAVALNGGTADVGGQTGQVVRPGTISVS